MLYGFASGRDAPESSQDGRTSSTAAVPHGTENTQQFLGAVHERAPGCDAAWVLVDPVSRSPIEGLTPEQMAKMEKDMEVLQRDLKQIEASHADEVLNLVLARGYLAKLFGNARIVRYLAQNYADILWELQTIAEPLRSRAEGFPRVRTLVTGPDSRRPPWHSAFWVPTRHDCS
jgi:hypothetical protein